MKSPVGNNRAENNSRGSVERWLLVVILLLQIIITWGIYLRGDSSDAVCGTAAEGADISSMPKSSTENNPLQYTVRSHHSRDPFAAMDSMMIDAFRDMARLRSGGSMDDGWDSLSVSPTMDMRSSDLDYIVSMSIPGVDPSNINVSLSGRVLTVQAAKSVSQNEYSGVRHFERRILLPGSIGDANDVRADMTNGILRVYVPKGSHEDQNRITIRLF
jgi:HSP20 family protein